MDSRVKIKVNKFLFVEKNSQFSIGFNFAVINFKKPVLWQKFLL